jgi:DNA-directed RNA polymerase subunit L
MTSPRISAVSTDPNNSSILLFTLSDVNVSIANALRRILQCEIQVPCFKSESNEEKHKCQIVVNTTRFTNEVIKQRLSCVPIYIKDTKINAENYILEIDVKNSTKDVVYVTTKDFKLKNKTTGKNIKDETVNKIFPPNEMTGDYIEFLRLMPANTSSQQGEHIKLTCPLTYGIAKESGCFKAVSLATYGNTLDEAKASLAWEAEEQRLLNEGDIDDEKIMMEKRNWYLLEGKRHFIQNSFDFKVKSIGVFQNEDLLNMAVNVLKDKLTRTSSSIKSNDKDYLEIKNTITNMPYSYDIILYNEDYTLGKVLEYYCYEQYYEKQPLLSFVGFRKEHPTDTKSILRIAFKENTPNTEIIKIIDNICSYVISILNKIKF